MPNNLGIKRVEALHYFVRDLSRSRRFYTELMDFAETSVSGPEVEANLKQRSATFEAGGCRIICSEPIGEGGRAWSYLRRHPDGVGTVIFEVEDADHTFKTLLERGATAISDVIAETEDGGTIRHFAITTPFGETTFRYVQRDGFEKPAPGHVMHETPKGGANRFGFTHFDHITSNFATLKPALLWMEHVLGMEQFWEVEFHTEDVAKTEKDGSGLESVVMIDKEGGVKFANNEPKRPHFYNSQIWLFVSDNHGDGIQHAALATPDLISCTRGLRERNVEFMPTPGTYYDMLPARIEQSGIGSIDEDIEILRELEILVDGDGDHSYLLQIFLADSAGLYRESEAGPFFFELIQRKGDEGFGAGNFRALFESIERAQKDEGRI